MTIDRDQLTEALNKTGLAEFMVNEDTEPRHVRIVRDAARILLAFPTDETVEAAWGKLVLVNPVTEADVRAALEAVRQTMIGDTTCKHGMPTAHRFNDDGYTYSECQGPTMIGDNQ
jgi:hypothetical protein